MRRYDAWIKPTAVRFYEIDYAWKKGEHPKRAIADYDRAIALKPDNASAYYTRGNAYYQKGDLERAIADFQKVVELGGNPKAVADARKRLEELGAR